MGPHPATRREQIETVHGLTRDAGHVYRYKGAVRPGVTRVLSPHQNLDVVDPAILAAAAEFGQHVHEAVHLFNIGELDRGSLDPLVEAHLVQWERFLAESGAVVIYSEAKVYSARYGYAGQLDDICAMPKRQGHTLIDVKTGAAVPRTSGPQTAAYNEAWHEMTGSRRMKRASVHLRESDYVFVPHTNPQDWDIFKAALILHRWNTGE